MWAYGRKPPLSMSAAYNYMWYGNWEIDLHMDSKARKWKRPIMFNQQMISKWVKTQEWKMIIQYRNQTTMGKSKSNLVQEEVSGIMVWCNKWLVVDIWEHCHYHLHKRFSTNLVSCLFEDAWVYGNLLQMPSATPIRQSQEVMLASVIPSWINRTVTTFASS